MRRQGDQRHRRDPVVQGEPRRERSAHRPAAVRRVAGRRQLGARRHATAAPGRAAAASRAAAAAAADLQVYARRFAQERRSTRSKAAYEAANPGTTLTISTDSSSALETKIEQGAPADVFLSADTTNPQKLVDARARVGRGHAVRRQPADGHRADGQPGRDRNAGGPREGRHQGRRGRRQGADHEVRHAARRQPRQAAGLPGRLRGRVRGATSSPRRTTSSAVVAKIELGEGDAGIVYVTDAKGVRRRSTTVAVPDSANVPATYGGVVVKASAPPAAAAAFLAGSPVRRPGRARRAGFLPPAMTALAAGR